MLQRPLAILQSLEIIPLQILWERLLFRPRQMLKPIQMLLRHLGMNIASTSTQIRTYRHQIKHQTR